MSFSSFTTIFNTPDVESSFNTCFKTLQILFIYLLFVRRFVRFSQVDQQVYLGLLVFDNEIKELPSVKTIEFTLFAQFLIED